MTWSQFLDAIAPEGRRYWAVQRECHNVALLQMIQAAVGNSTEPIYLNPEPKTFEDAIANLSAFSDEGRRKQMFRQLPNAVLYSTVPRLRECFGWTKVSGRELYDLPQDIRPQSDVTDGVKREILRTEEYYAIVYEFIPDCQLGMDLQVVQSQLDFYWLVGFCIILTRPENWAAPGMLMDMADIVCPWHAAWSRTWYKRRLAK